MSSILMILVWSTIMGVCSTNWVTAWVCLEINTLAMCWVIAKDMKKWKTQEAPTFMYFMVQATASIVFLLSAAQQPTTLSSFLVFISLLAKMGVWPMHTWYLKLISMMEMKQTTMLIIMSWQKIMPIILMVCTAEKMNNTVMIGVVALLTLVTPLTNLVSKLSVKSIMGVSSFNNNSWLMVAAVTSMSSFWVFLALYSSTLMATLKSFSNLTSKTMKMSKSFWSSLLIVSNMGGLPPMTMFWAKILVVSIMVSGNLPMEMCLLLVMTACYLLYHYLWMTLNETTQSPNKSQMSTTPQKTEKMVMTAMFTSIMAMVVLITLGLTQSDLSW